MKKNYTNPDVELLSLQTSDVIANSALSKIIDDTTVDVYAGASEGYERVI